MKTIRKLLLKVSSAFLKRRGNGVRLLLFHEIKDYQRDAFEYLINALYERYGFISPDDYHSVISMGGVRFIVSFDDGFRSQAEIARAVLDPLGIKALFFVCPDFVDLQAEAVRRFVTLRMRRNDVCDVPPDLYPIPRKELALLASDGHVIGSHGRTHAMMTQLGGDEERAREIASSHDMLESISGRKVEWFAYPYGDITSIDSSSLEVIGRNYRYCCSGIRGINTRSTHRLCLRRENINLDIPVDQICRIAEGGFDFLYYFKRKTLDAMTGENGQRL